MVRPPKPGSPSYDLWKKETDPMLAILSLRDDPQARFGLDERIETLQTMDLIRPSTGEARGHLGGNGANLLGRSSQTHPDNQMERQQHHDPLADSQPPGGTPSGGRGSQTSGSNRATDASVTVSHLSSVDHPPHHDYVQGVGSTDIPRNTATNNIQRNLLPQQYSSGFVGSAGRDGRDHCHHESDPCLRVQRTGQSAIGKLDPTVCGTLAQEQRPTADSQDFLDLINQALLDRPICQLDEHHYL